MAVKGYQTRILVDGYDFSGVSNVAQMACAVGALEYSVFQTAGVLRLPGAAAATLEHRGYYNGKVDGTLEKELYDRLGTTDAVYTTLVLDTAGAIPVAYTLANTWNGQLTLAAPVKELLTVAGQWQGADRRMYRGYQLYRGTISATGAQDYIDFGAAGAVGGVAHLHVTAVVGTATNATITVQCDDNTGFTSPTTLGTFTFSGNATTGLQALQLSLGAGVVDRYVRINCTSLGGATSFTVAAVAGVSGVTY